MAEGILDVYRQMAALVLSKKPEEVTTVERQAVIVAVDKSSYTNEPDLDQLLRFLPPPPKEALPALRDLLHCIYRGDVTGIENFKHGLYTHYKGGKYRTILTAMDSETEKPTVVYVSLSSGEFWVRPLEMFAEIVIWPDGKYRSRFVRIKD
jgi:hypothetical protein